MSKSIETFRDAPVPKAVLSNIIPSIISMIMVLVYNLADTFFIGQTKNPYMVAAVSIATPVFLLFMAVGMLFGIGGTSLISRMLGEGKHKYAKHTASFCFWSGIVIGIISMVLIIVFVEPICLMVGASKDTLGYSKEYLGILAMGIPFLIISNTFSNIVRADGNAKKAMLGVVLGNIANIVLDPIMILGFGWNVAGAAIATVIGNIVSSVVYISHLVSKKTMLSIKIKDFRISRRIVFGVLAIGIPASLNSVLMSSSHIILNNMMSGYDDMAVAGVGVAMKVNMVVVMLLIGLGTGIQPLLGYCYGANNRKRYMDILKFSIVLALGLSLVMTAVCFFGAAPLVRAFLDDQSAFSYGFQFSRIYIISGPVLGVLFVLVNAIQATGAAFPSLILSISRQGLVYLPLLVLFRFVFDSAKMLVLTQPVTDYAAVIMAAVIFVFTMKKYFPVKES
ncbi:MAG: MATE family efflux transporter [Lachnospiraceae bacterium]|nr:MATE family efflux transporter [Lachnospiraceae bacterium]